MRSVVVTAVCLLGSLLLAGCDRRVIIVPPAQSGAGSGGQTGQPVPAEVAAPVSVPVAVPETAIRFEDATAGSGIAFLHHADRSEQRLMPEIMGSGVLLADFNRDGACDVLVVDGGSVRSVVRPSGQGNRLFLNDGDGTFTDTTGAWMVASRGYGMGGTVGDFDNDGWPDVLLTTFGGGDQLLRNTGSRFEDITAAAGPPADGRWSTGAAALDFDNDGWLDLYLVRYVEYDPETALPARVNGVHVYSTPLLHSGIPDLLLRNEGGGRLAKFSGLPGAESDPSPTDWKGLAVGAADLDLNGRMDVYVANDSCRNLMFIHSTPGPFEETARLSGTAYGDTGKEEAGMGVDFGDVNGDGKLDIVCTNFQGEPANLYCQTGPLFFVDRTDALGTGSTTRARMKWGCKFLDADNDGDDDLLVANGHLYDQIETMATGIKFGQPNSLFENRDGRLVDVSTGAGTALQDAQVSRGLAVADFNHDGRLDYCVSNNAGTLQLARNATEPAGNFVSLWLEGVVSNRSAIGTRLRAKVGDRTILRQVFGGTSYLSAHDLRVHFGLGAAEVIDELVIEWPSGQTQTFSGLQVNRHYHLLEGGQPEVYEPGKGVLVPRPR